LEYNNFEKRLLLNNLQGLNGFRNFRISFADGFWSLASPEHETGFTKTRNQVSQKNETGLAETRNSPKHETGLAKT